MDNLTPNNKNSTKKVVYISLGLLLLLLVGAYVLWPEKFFKSKTSPALEYSKTKSQEQKDNGQTTQLREFAARQGYPSTVPGDLILNPTVQVKTTVYPEKKGPPEYKVEYEEPKSIEDSKLIYSENLKAQGWTVTAATSDSQTIRIAKGSVEGSISFSVAGPITTKIILTYKDNAPANN